MIKKYIKCKTKCRKKYNDKYTLYMAFLMDINNYWRLKAVLTKERWRGEDRIRGERTTRDCGGQNCSLNWAEGNIFEEDVYIARRYCQNRVIICANIPRNVFKRIYIHIPQNLALYLNRNPNYAMSHNNVLDMQLQALEFLQE